MTRHLSEYIPKRESFKPIEVADRDRRRAAALGSYALLTAIRGYFERGGRG